MLVPTARMAAPLCEAPVARACIERLREAGCELELVEAYRQRAAAAGPSAAALRLECDLLRAEAGAVDPHTDPDPDPDPDPNPNPNPILDSNPIPSP